MELSDALDLRPGDLVAIVGGGGKTAALYRLGVELAARSLPVLLSGTTRFTPPEVGDPPNLLLVEGEREIREALEGGRTPLTVAAGWGSKGRLLPLELEWVDAIHRSFPGLTIVVEADGSAMRPFKAPGEHEPVIPATTTLLVAVAGMDAIGRPLDERHVHRPERVAAIAGSPIGSLVTAEVVAEVLGHPQGGRKGLPKAARWVPLLNKADTGERGAAAERVAALLAPTAERIVIAHLKRTPPMTRVIAGASGG